MVEEEVLLVNGLVTSTCFGQFDLHLVVLAVVEVDQTHRSFPHHRHHPAEQTAPQIARMDGNGLYGGAGGGGGSS